jgi:hypothetical protein
MVSLLALVATLLVPASRSALAADLVKTVAADFNAGNSFFDNITPANNDLRVVAVQNLNGDWFRGHLNKATWQVDVEKESDTLWSPDTCLSTATNPWSDQARFEVESGYTYRTGPASTGGQELGLAPGMLAPPVSNMQVETVRFISHGARVEAARYVVTVNRAGATDLLFDIPIPAADEANRGGAGAGGGGGSWVRKSVDGFVADAANADCLGNEADEIVITLPTGSEVVSIGLSYATEVSPGPNGEWLGGPVGLSMETFEAEIDRAFVWSGRYRSASRVDAAVQPPEGGTPIWKQVAWSDSNFGSNSEGDIYVRCGSDSNDNGSISGSEWKQSDDGPTGSDVWQGPFSIRDASSAALVPCTGTHLQHRVDLFVGFDASPRLNDVTFTYNPDADSDGAFAEPGDGPVDCDDTDSTLNFNDADGDGFASCDAISDCNDDAPDVYPNAVVAADDVDDGVDRDCDGADECFRDNDMDGQGSSRVIADDGDGTCESVDGESLNDLDCLDNNPNVFDGNPNLITGDGIDQDCNGAEECYVSADRDPYGIDEIIDESPDAGRLCETADGEAVPQPGGLFDCDDTDPTTHPGIIGFRNDCLTPVAVNDPATTARNVAVTIAVVANDVDPNGDPLLVHPGSVSDPANGMATVVGSQIRYTPNGDFFGTDSFTYQVSDGSRVGPDAATVTVTVTDDATPEPPIVFCEGKQVTINMEHGASGMGTAGDDVILGTGGPDTIDAGAGNDTVCAGDGDDTVNAGAGDDIVIGGDGNDNLNGGAGRDIMRGNAGIDVLRGGDGPDRLLGGIDGDTLDGGEGDDYLGGFGGNDTILGGNGNETIWGGFGADTIDGGPGNDEIHGLIGNDIIDGGLGNDRIDGDRGNDQINGGPGNDVLRGGNANDVIHGDSGDDNISGGKADDTLSGGDGQDTCIGNLQGPVGDTADSTCETVFGVP